MLHIFIARMQRRQFYRYAWAGKNIGGIVARLHRDGLQRIAIGRQIAGGIGFCVGRFAQHIERIAVIFFGVAERFLDGAAEHELAAEDFAWHR